jgi:uncharacterized protein (DUF1697 family)
MATWIMLLRGVNVGGRRSLSMQVLSALVEEAGGSEVETYIQSGNVVFVTAGELAADFGEEIARSLRAHVGLDVKVLILALADLEDVARKLPFADPGLDPATVHAFFLDRAVGMEIAASLDALKGPDESWHLDGRVLYLHAPRGIGGSKFARGAEKRLGVAATARNWRTVSELLLRARRHERSGLG